MVWDSNHSTLQQRFNDHLEPLSLWWANYLSSLQRQVFGRNASYSDQRQVDLMLTAVAAAASRWARSPGSRRPRRPASAKHAAQQEHRRGDARDFDAVDLGEELAICVQHAIAESTANLALGSDMMPFMVPLQLGSMQCAVSEIYSSLYPPTAILETLHLMLLEQLPPELRWCA